MSVHKNKSNNTWYVKYKNTTKRGFRTKHDALMYEAKLKLSKEKKDEYILFYEVINSFLKDYQSEVSYGSYDKIKHILDCIIIPNVENKNIHQISEMDCRKFYKYISLLDYSTSYKNLIINTYKRIFKYAKTYFNLKNQPTYVLDPLKKTFSEKMKVKEKEMKVWTQNDFNRFIVQVEKPIYKELFVILYYTGLRLGEALALKWSDYNQGKLSINKSLTTKTNKGAYEIKEPKNVFSIRDVELGSVIDSFLSDFKEREKLMSGFNDDWFIFGRLTPLSQSTLSRIKDEAINKAGIKRITNHEFRHSHASNLIANGINVVAVSKRLGHSDVNMTLKVYTHLFKKSEVELIKFIDESSQNLLTH